MEAETLTPAQVAGRFSGQIERLYLPQEGRGRRVTVTGISVGRDAEQRDVLQLRMADAADIMPFLDAVKRVADPELNAWRTPFHKAMHGLPLKFTFPTARI